MNKRSYNRRSDDQLIDALQDKIREIEGRLESRKRRDSAVLKEIPKLKRKLGTFAQLCVDHERQDLANTVLGFMSTLDLQARKNSQPSESHG